MPGAGKSTVGIILAKQAALQFVDTDVLIQAGQQRSLQDLVDTDGYLALRRIEEEALLGLSVRNCVIATGGSAVYSELGMAHLKADGVVVYLHVERNTLEARIHNYSTRGIAKRPGQSFADLFQERSALYARYADITIKNMNLSHEQLCADIIAQTQNLLTRA
jgi:shikimate kinase